MTLSRKLTWMHVSDLHFRVGEEYDRSVVLKALVQAAHDLHHRGERRPDLLFVTGDIAFSGKPEEYAAATDFLDELRNALKLEKSRMFVIPGNHDVDRDAADGLKRTLETENESMQYFGSRGLRRHFDKLNAYTSWHDTYFKAENRISPRTTCYVHEPFEINGLRVQVLAVNSALFCLDNDDNGKLWIGRRCLDDALMQMIATQSDLRIALVHHPLDWLHDEEQSHIRAKLRDRMDLILRGHLHRSDVEWVASYSGSYLQLAAGASYQTRKYPNRLLLTTVEYDRRHVKVFPLCYQDDPNEVWALETGLFPAAPNYEGDFTVEWKQSPRSMPLKLEANKTAPETDSAATAPRVTPPVRDSRDVLAVLQTSSSTFGQRLSVSREAKETIARYCSHSGFWRADDVVFLEAGTLPMIMLLELYENGDPGQRPVLLLTNNLGCIAVAMTAQKPVDESHVVYPTDVTRNCLLLGGLLMDDYAATIPEDLLGKPQANLWESSVLPNYLQEKQASHIVMMVTKITRIDGPCAASPHMRRFKKLLLHYVADHPEVRLSILGEAEKFFERRGWSADSIELTASDESRYWEEVLQSGRTTIITALSPEMSPAQIGIVKREILDLQQAGATCILLDTEGNQIAV